MQGVAPKCLRGRTTPRGYSSNSNNVDREYRLRGADLDAYYHVKPYLSGADHRSALHHEPIV